MHKKWIRNEGKTENGGVRGRWGEGGGGAEKAGGTEEKKSCKKKRV